MSGRYRHGFIAAGAGSFSRQVPLAPAPFPFQNSLHSLPAGWRTKPLQRGSPGARELRIAPRPVAGAKNIFCRDDPRVARRSSFWFWLVLAALSVATTLRLPLPLAVRGLAVASPRFPGPPLPGLFAARLTAIARQRLLGPELSLTALQQAISIPGTARPALENLGSRLIFRRRWAIFSWGHGSAYSQKLKSRRGTLFPFGALSLQRGERDPRYITPSSDRIKTNAWRVMECLRTEQQHSPKDCLFFVPVQISLTR